METSVTWLGRLVDAPTGDEWKHLMDVYAPLLNSWTIRAGVTPSDRDDLVQEILLVVVRRVREFERERPGAFRAWLRAIFANRLMKYFAKLPQKHCGFPVEGLTDTQNDLARLLDREHDEHLARQVMKLVEKDFTPSTWIAFQEQVLKGRKPMEIANELNLSLNAVIKAKSRVMQRLRQEFAGLFEE